MTIREYLIKYISNNMMYKGYSPMGLIEKMMEIRPILKRVVDMKYTANAPIMSDVYNLLSEAAELTPEVVLPENSPPENVEIDLDFSQSQEGKGSFLSSAKEADISKLLEAFESELRENEEIKPLLEKTYCGGDLYEFSSARHIMHVSWIKSIRMVIASVKSGPPYSDQLMKGVIEVSI